MFEGGVALRFVMAEFLQSLPVEQRAMGFRYLQKHGALNISDFDFEIIRKQKVADPGETHAMILETYAVLLGLQKAMAVEVRLRQAGKRMHRLMNTRWEAQQVQDELKVQAAGPSSTSSRRALARRGVRRHRLPVRRRAPGGARALGPLRRQERRMAPAPARQRLHIQLRRGEALRRVGQDVFEALGIERVEQILVSRSTAPATRTSARTSSTSATTTRRSPRSSTCRASNTPSFFTTQTATGRNGATGWAAR